MKVRVTWQKSWFKHNAGRAQDLSESELFRNTKSNKKSPPSVIVVVWIQPLWLQIRSTLCNRHHVALISLCYETWPPSLPHSQLSYLRHQYASEQKREEISNHIYISSSIKFVRVHKSSLRNHTKGQVFSPFTIVAGKVIVFASNFSEVCVNCFPSCFPSLLREGNYSAETEPLIFLQISCTITTVSVGCHRDWGFNFLQTSPDAVMSWHPAAGSVGLLCLGPLTASFSNQIWKGEWLYSSPGIHHCQPPAPPSPKMLLCMNNEAARALSASHFPLSDSSPASHWISVCFA